MEKNLRESILERMRAFSTPDRPVYLVGGAVRDLLLDRPAHDLDFALPGPTRKLAQEVASQLNAALYVMDEERDTTRVVLDLGQQRLLLDFASLRAADLEGDLRARDFTINALALDVAQPDRLIDPTGGFADLREKRIRACSPGSLQDDPVRVLRAIRQALCFQYRIDPDTIRLMKAAAPRLTNTSPERMRDELFKMLDGDQINLAVRLLDQVGALKYLLPELEALKGVAQSAPHTLDVWEHTLSTVYNLEQLYASLVGHYVRETVPDLTVGSAVLWLGRYREPMEEHYNRLFVPDRSPRALLFLAALYHDIAKPVTRQETPEGKVRFLDHPNRGVKMLTQRARELMLSVAEIQRLETIVAHHMRVHFLTEQVQSGQGIEIIQEPGEERTARRAPSRRAIYRFFKDTDAAGVDICLLSLADLRGTYNITLPQDLWQAELETCRALLEAYWEKNEEVIAPPRLLSGDDLMHEFNLKPGRVIGQLLNLIRETQAAGEVASREDALALARGWLEHGDASLGASPAE